MGYIEKKVSSRSILAKIARVIKPSDSAWQADAIEEIGWAMQAIGYHCGFEQRATPANKPIEVKSHRAMVPCEADRVLWVEELIKQDSSANLLDANGKNIYTTDTGECYKGYRLPLGTDETLKSLAQENAKRTIAVTPTSNYYNLQGDYIVTGFQECVIRIHYVGFPVDEEGLPLILDDFDYKNCIFWYVLSQMILSGYPVHDMNFGLADAKFTQFLPKAQNAPKIPSVDGMEAFANMWLRYSGRRKQHQNFAINFEQQEYVDF
jgi:hypothetical protein